ncbi:MAG: hypothetical protein ACR2IH_06655 [Pyrinomonadaceae bacterium]
MILRIRSIVTLSLLCGSFVVGASGQAVTSTTKVADKVAEKKTSTPAEEPKSAKAPKIDASKPLTAEQVAESTILVYAFPGGRETLNHIRQTAVEKGKTTTTGADGKSDSANYQRWTLRSATDGSEKIRLDQEYSTARFSLVSSEDKVFGIFNESVFTPRDDATRAFQNQNTYNIEALLRYKENGSTISLAGRQKELGVEYYMMDVTDKQQRKMRFYVSVKSFRVMMLAYEDTGLKYKRKYYNYNYAQGTLVPYRSVLYAGDKVIEETEIGTVTYGQKIDAALFSAG